MNGVWAWLTSIAKSPEQKAIAQEQFADYRAEYLSRYREVLVSRSRLVSPMIAGPSGFPVERMRKIGAAYGKRVGDFTEWHEKARKRMRNAILGPIVISSSHPDAPDLIAAKISKLKELQERMKAANVIVKAKSLTPERKVEKLIGELGYTKEKAGELLKPDFAGRVGYPSFELTSNLANIRRLEARIPEIQRLQASPERKATFDGGRVEESKEKNRIQIFFEKIPSAEVRDKLKSRGFHWSPREKAWQRQLTQAARYDVEQIFGVKLE